LQESEEAGIATSFNEIKIMHNITTTTDLLQLYLF
jgi:hypothetical protein